MGREVAYLAHLYIVVGVVVGFRLGAELKHMALQMTWQQSHRRKNPPVGLRNLGNTCYLNSVLQCLTYTPPLANFCLKNQHSSSCEFLNGSRFSNCPFCLLEKWIVRSLSLDGQLDAPVRIQNSLHLFAKHFRPGRQEDAHEFLRYVIEACNNVCIKQHKTLTHGKCQNVQGTKPAKGEPNTIVKEIFGGILQSQVKCLSCSAESNKLDEIMDISLDILHANSLKEALCRFFQPEVLDGNNKYNCEKCKRLSAARKQMSIFRAPNVLVIQLKRFEDIYGGKIDRNIVFQECLGLAGHISRDSQDARPEYALFGTIVHSGYSQDSGHYYAYVKDSNGSWYCCNDTHVSPATTQAVLSEKVYVLFFIRSNPRPKTDKDVPSCNGATPPTHSHANGNGAGVSTSHRPPESWNSSPGVPSRMTIVENGSSSVSKFPKSQIKYGSLKPAVPQAGRSGENGKDIKFCATSGDVKIESSVRRMSAGTCSAAPFSAGLKVDASLTQRQLPDSDRQLDNDRFSSLPSQSSPLISSSGCTLGEISEPSSCVPGSINRDLYLPDGQSPSFCAVNVMPGSKDHRSSDKFQEAVNGICNGHGVTEIVQNMETGESGGMLDGFNSRRSSVKDGQSSLSKENEKFSEGSLLTKRRREEHEFSDTENGHVPVESEHNVESRKKSEANGAEKLSDLEKLKQILVKEGRDHLRSCGWSDDVRDTMRARKRSCTQICLSSSNTDLRKFLIHEVKDPFIRRVPESLKEQLIQHLRSFFRGKR